MAFELAQDGRVVPSKAGVAGEPMTLVDTDVILDVLTADPHWADWSVRQLDVAASRGKLLINDVVYAELSVTPDTTTSVGKRGS